MNESLTKKTVSSAAWTYLAYGMSKSANFLSTVVLARLLLKSEFGIVAFAVTVLAFLDAVRDFGIGLAVIQWRKQDGVEEASVYEMVSTAFWLSVGSNVLFWLLSVAIAPLVADFFREPQIVQILPIMAFSFVISSLGSIHDALLQREMAFDKRLIPAVFNSVSKGITSVVLAFMGFGVWALVVGLLVGQSVYSLAVWRLVPFRPLLEFRWQQAKHILRYGTNIALDNILSALQANMDYVFIGRFLGDVALGVYTIAYRVPELIIINFCTVIAQVLFPAYSSVQNDLPQLKQAVLVALRYVAIITVPAGVGLALIASAFVPVAFGMDWLEAVPIMSVLSLYGLFLSVSWNIGDLYKAIDRVDLLWKTGIFELVLLLPVLYVMALRSAYAVALGHVVVAFIVSFVRLWIAIYILDLSPRKTFSQFIPAIVSVAFMGIVVYGLGVLLSSSPPLLVLIAQVVAGGVTYVAVLWNFERELLMRLWGMVGKRFQQKTA